MAAEYIIYCDESGEKNDYFSNFYSGTLIRGEHYEEIVASIRAKKLELKRPTGGQINISNCRSKWNVSRPSRYVYLDSKRRQPPAKHQSSHQGTLTGGMGSVGCGMKWECPLVVIESTTAATTRITNPRIATTRPQLSRRRDLPHCIQLQHFVEPSLAVLFIKCVDDAPHDRNPLPTRSRLGLICFRNASCCQYLVSFRCRAAFPGKGLSLGM